MRSIGFIGNYYGGLSIRKKGVKYYWIIENYDTNFDDMNEWSPIPGYLYRALNRYQDELGIDFDND